MNQDYYNYIMQIHQKQVKISHLHQGTGRSTSENPNLHKRFLLFTSDLLLGIGQRIRPAEFAVQVQAPQSHEGALDIESGCC
ncbi:MAG: hypothetical protein ACK2UE_02710 [Anaerolineales bacterium]